LIDEFILIIKYNCKSLKKVSKKGPIIKQEHGIGDNNEY